MIFILLTFLISLSFSEDINFAVFGIGTDMRIIFWSKDNCDFPSCPKIICDILSNTSSAYIALYPSSKIISCPKTIPNFDVNMITFIFKENKEMMLPIPCNNIQDCMIKSCELYLSKKESFAIAFTGQCL